MTDLDRALDLARQITVAGRPGSDLHLLASTLLATRDGFERMRKALTAALPVLLERKRRKSPS